MGCLSRDLFGCCLNINNKSTIDKDGNLTTNNSIVRNNLTVNHDLNIKGALNINNVTLAEVITNTITNDSTLYIFEGTTVNNGDVVEHILFNQINHARTILELKVFIHDVNSNTFWRYLDGKYMWYREWTNQAQELVIGTPHDIGSGDPFHYTIERLETDNNISIRITQNTSIDTNTKYKIIAKIIQL